MGFKERLAAFYEEVIKSPAKLTALLTAIVVTDIILLLGNTGPQRVGTAEADSLGLGGGGGLIEGGEELTPEQQEVAAAAARAQSRKSGKSGGGGTKVGVDIPISDTEMAVGLAYSEDPGAANAAAGFAGIGQVDQKRGWDAMVAEVNKNPPFKRKVVPVYYSFTTADVQTKGAQQIYEEACTKWTKDNKVFMAWVTATDTLNSCLTKARVPQLGGGSGFSYAQTWKDYPWLVEHNSSALDRMAEDQITQLVARGYFTKCTPRYAEAIPCVNGQPRIGLIRYDQPSHDAAAARMKATLAKHGLQLCEGCEFEVSYSDGDVAAQLDDATEVNNAINNCRLSHAAPGAAPGPCTHMLFLGSIAGVRITLFYIQRAEDQGYYARLGFNRMDAPAAVRDFFANADQNNYLSQFTASILVSYAPGDFDIEPAAFQQCVKLFKDAGETFEGSEASNKFGQIPGYCDTAWFHQAAFTAAGRDVTLDSWLKGVANAGIVKSAGTFVMRTTSSRRDGAGAVRVGDWEAGGSCQCWKDVSGNIPV